MSLQNQARMHEDKGCYFVTLTAKTRKALQGMATVACGILGLVLFRWTPTTGKGVLIYAALFAVLIVMVILLSPRKPAGYWPDKPDGH